MPRFDGVCAGTGLAGSKTAIKPQLSLLNRPPGEGKKRYAVVRDNRKTLRSVAEPFNPNQTRYSKQEWTGLSEEKRRIYFLTATTVDRHGRRTVTSDKRGEQNTNSHPQTEQRNSGEKTGEKKRQKEVRN